MTDQPTDDLTSRLQGLWLPLITPFRDGELDEASLRRLVRHYAAGPVDGFILAATSGEGMSLRADELERLVTVTRSELSGSESRMPILLGLSGASTAKLLDALDETATWPIDGYLIASPYYIRPSQRGLVQHFAALADHASWPIVLYNIPYRTGVSLTNETLLQLALHPNIVGMKDCSADRAQSIDFISRKPSGFRVLTGERLEMPDQAALRGPRVIGARDQIAVDRPGRGFIQCIQKLRGGSAGQTQQDWQAATAG